MKSSKPTPSEFYGNPGIYAENNAAAKFARKIARNAIALAAMIVVLAIMGEDQLNDELKSADVLSNTKHIAAIDRANESERARINTVLATAGNEMKEGGK